MPTRSDDQPPAGDVHAARRAARDAAVAGLRGLLQTALTFWVKLPSDEQQAVLDRVPSAILERAAGGRDLDRLARQASAWAELAATLLQIRGRIDAEVSRLLNAGARRGAAGWAQIPNPAGLAGPVANLLGDVGAAS